MARIHRKTVQKSLNDLDNHDGVVTNLEPDILECEVKWASGSITTNKATGDDRIQTELFEILKVNAVIMLLSICQQIWKTQQWPQDWGRSVFIPIPKKGNAKVLFVLPYKSSFLPYFCLPVLSLSLTGRYGELEITLGST